MRKFFAHSLIAGIILPMLYITANPNWQENCQDDVLWPHSAQSEQVNQARDVGDRKTETIKATSCAGARRNAS